MMKSRICLPGLYSTVVVILLLIRACRRKMNPHTSRLAEPIVMGMGLMNVLERYIDANIDDVTCMIARFLNLFFTNSPLVEASEADAVIRRSTRMLCSWYLDSPILLLLKLTAI
jgi:hypothetical protein